MVNASDQALYYVQNEALWTAATDLTPAHDAASASATKALAAYVGNRVHITETKELLLPRRELSNVTVRQLERLLLLAAEGPMTRPPRASRPRPRRLPR